MLQQDGCFKVVGGKYFTYKESVLTKLLTEVLTKMLILFINMQRYYQALFFSRCVDSHLESM